ncbi:hypothetical protein GCK32_018069 [Trichostrongylus colubriformis]|uniref:Uncharacterized protein n=1 Tax=Trichostrongylus colubriformis TaxID=6319 RepID=A0AAN8FTI8_TRICO
MIYSRVQRDVLELRLKNGIQEKGWDRGSGTFVTTHTSADYCIAYVGSIYEFCTYEPILFNAINATTEENVKIN